eukprot:TCONS_00009377-protein
MVLERTLIFFGSMISVSCLTFAVCSQFWAEFYFDGKRYHTGLWRVCYEKADECDSFNTWLDEGEKIPSWLSEIRILICLASILAGIALLTSLLGILYLKIKSVYTSVINFISCALLVGVCLIFYESKYFHNERQLLRVRHLWAFYLTISTAGWTFLMAVFGIMADYCCCCCKKDRTLEVNYGDMDIYDPEHV